jgi:hypothetical protein
MKASTKYWSLNPSASQYDILRIGADVLSWDAPHILRPLDTIDFDVDSVFKALVGGLERPFSNVLGKTLCNPHLTEPASLVLPQGPVHQTRAQAPVSEMYHVNLEVPKTFEQINRMASFFSSNSTTGPRYPMVPPWPWAILPFLQEPNS